MSRPCKCRKIGQEPPCASFRPCGVPRASLKVVVLSLDEFEAVRLADLEGLYQEEAAACLGVARQTFGNIVKSARRKIAEALTGAKAIRIEGGAVKLEKSNYKCLSCDYVWFVTSGKERPKTCPCCLSRTVRHLSAAKAVKIRGRA